MKDPDFVGHGEEGGTLCSPADCIVPVDLALHSEEIILAACEEVAGECHAWLHHKTGAFLHVVLKTKNERAVPSLQGRFADALVTAAIRARIEAETGPIRHRLIETALAEALPSKRA